MRDRLVDPVSQGSLGKAFKRAGLWDQLQHPRLHDDTVSILGVRLPPPTARARPWTLLGAPPRRGLLLDAGTRAGNAPRPPAGGGGRGTARAPAGARAAAGDHRRVVVPDQPVFHEDLVGVVSTGGFSTWMGPTITGPGPLRHNLGSIKSTSFSCFEW